MAPDFPKRWIFLRGLTRGAFHWMGFEKKFKDFFKLEGVFAPELAGNGILNFEPSPTDINQAVQQLRNQIDATGQKIGLFSISMGGMIATRWAQMYPDEVTHLVVVNSSFSSLNPFNERLLPGNYPAIIKNFIFSDAENLEKFILNATSNFEEIWKPHLKELVQFQKKYPVSLANFIRQLQMSSTASCEPVPRSQTLILNSNTDRLVSYRCSQALAKKWACEIQSHPTAGHDLALDDPEWVLRVIKNKFCTEPA